MKKYKVTIDNKGTIRWYNEEGAYHRLEGPAIECSNGDKYWYEDGKHHRLDGPAIEITSGTKYWYQEGKLHRLDGPAIEYSAGNKNWYINGERFTKEEFNKQVNSPEGKVVEIEGVKYRLTQV